MEVEKQTDRRKTDEREWERDEGKNIKIKLKRDRQTERDTCKKRHVESKIKRITNRTNVCAWESKRVHGREYKRVSERERERERERSKCISLSLVDSLIFLGMGFKALQVMF